MKTQGLNLFIVDDNPLLATGLKHYLDRRFGIDLNIFTFHTGESALKKVDKDTDIIILDYFLEGENENDILTAIKGINNKTEIIMLASHEDIGFAIESFRKRATDYVIKGSNSWNSITSLVYKIITYPVRVTVKEFGISKFLAVFLLTFVCLGIGVYATLKFFY